MPVTPARRRSFTQVVRGPQASAADFGGLEARALQQTGAVVADLGQQAFRLAQERDKFVAQEAYNRATATGRTLSAEVSALKGKNAVGATSRLTNGMDAEVEKLTEGMSRRQRELFERNWSPRRQGFIGSATTYEAQQTQAAFLSEKTTVVKDAKTDYANTGDEAAYTAGLAALDDAMNAQGLTAEEKRARRDAYENQLQASRVDHLIKIKDFEGAYEALGLSPDMIRPDGTVKEQGFLGEQEVEGGFATEYSVQSDAVKVNGKRVDFPTLVPTLTDEEKDTLLKDVIPGRKEIPEAIMQKAIAHAKGRISEGKSPFWNREEDGDGTPAMTYQQKLGIQAIEGAKYTAIKEAEAQAATRLTQADARVTELAIQQAPNDPFHVPSLEDFQAHYDDPAVALARWNERTVKMAGLRQQSLDAQAMAEANDPETRRSNLDAAYQVYFRAAAGDAGPEDIQGALDALSLDSGEEAKVARDLLTSSLKENILGTGDAVETMRNTILAQEATQFNKSNNKAAFGWFTKEIPGTVEFEDGKLKSTDEASAYFGTYMAGFDQYLKQRSSELGRGLTVSDVQEAADIYFEPLRTWKTREDIDRNVNDVLKTSIEGSDPTINVYEDVSGLLTELLQSLQTNVIPGAATNE